MNYRTIYIHVLAGSFFYESCICINLSIFLAGFLYFVFIHFSCRSFIKCISMFLDQ